MKLKYDVNINKQVVVDDIIKLVNQTYKLLPMREEGLDWFPTLNTIVMEVAGMSEILVGYHKELYSVLCKLEGLKYFTDEADYLNFRRGIFECINKLGGIADCVKHS